MSHYRTLESVTFVDNGKVLHFGPNQRVELTDAQAKALGDKVVDLTPVGARMFPDSALVIDAARRNPASDGANDHVVAEPVKPAKK